MQYAACLVGFLFFEGRGGPPAQFDSDYSGGEGASIYFFFPGMWPCFDLFFVEGLSLGYY